LEIELPDFEAKDEMLTGDHLSKVVEIVIGGGPTILEVRFMCLFMSLGRILLQDSIWTNHFQPMRQEVNFRKGEISISLVGNVYLAAETIPQGVHFAILVLWHPTFTFVSSTTFRIFNSSVLWALVLDYVFFPAYPSK
jgi:hypothetical protein